MACTPGILKILYPPMYSIPRIMYPRVQAKTPEICKIPGVLWPAIYGNPGINTPIRLYQTNIPVKKVVTK